MKKMVVVCLGVLILSAVAGGASFNPEPEAFALADRIGEPNARSFFLFSTSTGNYTLRQDGMGEFTSPKGLRRVFYLRPKGRIERVYFLEHQGDLFLLYEGDEWSQLMRMEQQKRKARWVMALPGGDAVQEPVIQGDVVMVQQIKISKSDGRIVGQD